MADRTVIELQGEAEVRRQLQRLTDELSDLRPLMTEIGQIMETAVQMRFDLKVDPSGRPWAAISPLTAQFYAITQGGQRKPSKDEWKSLRAGEVSPAAMPGSLLNRSGDMRGSLFSNAGADYVEIGMLRLTSDGRWNVPALHEFGTSRMPRRGLLTADPETGTLGDDDRQDILDAIARRLAQ